MPSISNILVVDDEPGIRTMVQFELSSQGHNILTAESGVKALDVIRENRVDLIITDMRMPVMDGLDMLVQVRKTHPLVPVILMTGFVEERVQKIVELGVVGTLHKPFTLDQLTEMVGKTIAAM